MIPPNVPEAKQEPWERHVPVDAKGPLLPKTEYDVVSIVTSPSRRRGRLRTVSKTTVSDAQSSGEITDPLRVPGFRPHHRKQTGPTGVPGQQGGRPELTPPILARPDPEIHPTIQVCKVPTPSTG